MMKIGTYVRINYLDLVNEPGTYAGETEDFLLVYPDSDLGRETSIRADGLLLLTSSEVTVEDLT